MSTKRKCLLALIITVIVLLVAFLAYMATTTIIGVVKVSKDSHKIVEKFEELYEMDGERVILFASPTCQFCQRLKPVLDEIEGFSYHYLDVTGITQGDMDKITKKLEIKIKGIPHMVVLKEKEVVGELSGYKDKEKVIQFLEKTGVIKGDV